MRCKSMQLALFAGLMGATLAALAAAAAPADASPAGKIDTLLDRWQVVEASKGGDVALWRDMMGIQLKQVAPATLDRLLAINTGSNPQSTGEFYLTFIYTLGTDIALRLQAQKAGQVAAQAQTAASTGASDAAATGAQSAKSSKVSPMALGSVGIDQTFTPITPCRVVDTRNVGGTIGAFAARNFFYFTNSASTNWGTLQGGVSGQAGTVCPGTVLVGFLPSAAVATITVTGQGGAGNLIVWQGTNPLASASTMSYPASGDIANLAVVPAGGRSGGGPGGPVQDFGVFVNAFTPTNVVVDIVGYYTQPAPTALECTYPQSFSSATAVPNGGLFSVSVPGCPTGFARVGVGCAATANPVGVPLLESSIARFSDCIWANNTGGTIDPSAIGFGGESACCRVPGH